MDPRHNWYQMLTANIVSAHKTRDDLIKGLGKSESQDRNLTITIGLINQFIYRMTAMIVSEKEWINSLGEKDADFFELCEHSYNILKSKNTMAIQKAVDPETNINTLMGKNEEKESIN